MRTKTLSPALVSFLTLLAASTLLAQTAENLLAAREDRPVLLVEPLEEGPGNPVHSRFETVLVHDAYASGDDLYALASPDHLFSGTPCQGGAPCQDWGHAVRFTPEHDLQIREIEVGLFTTAVGPPYTPIDIVVWADDGGHKPDLANEILRTRYTPDFEGVSIVSLDLRTDPAFSTTTLPAYHEFHVGAVWVPFDWQQGERGTAILMDDGQSTMHGRWTLHEDFWQSSSEARDCIPWPTWVILGGIGGIGQWTPILRLTVDYLDANVIADADRRFEEARSQVQAPAAARVAWGDFDADGDADLYTGGGLYVNLLEETGTAEFVQSGTVPGGFTGGLWGDLDNDGDLDLLTYGRRQSVFQNLLTETGAADFSEVPDPGLDDEAWNTTAAALGDVDGDGVLDVYLANFEDCTKCPLPPEYAAYYDGPCDGSPDPPDAPVPANPCIWKWAGPDYLFLGRGDLTFSDLMDMDISAPIWFEGPQQHRTFIGDTDGDTFSEIVLDDPTGSEVTYNWSRGVNMADADNDGDLDIYVPAYLLQRNLYWENQGSWELGTECLRETAQTHGIEGRYTEQACQDLGVTDTWGHGAGAAWGDVDRDEFLDLAAPHLAHSNWRGWSDRTRVWLGGQGAFTDHTAASRIQYMETDMVAHFADYDNDCDEDLFIASVYGEWFGRLFANDGAGAFTDDTYPTAVYADNVFQSAGWNDFDNDGDMDLLARDFFFRNRTDSQDPGRGWLKIEARGWASNRSAIGAKILVRNPLDPPGVVQVREVDGGSGSGSFEGLVQHFGLGCIGPGGTVDVEVRFPSGWVETLSGLAPQGPGEPPIVVDEGGARIAGPVFVCEGLAEEYTAEVRSGPFGLLWDLDDDGAFETPDPGGPVSYTPTPAPFQWIHLLAHDPGNPGTEINRDSLRIHLDVDPPADIRPGGTGDCRTAGAFCRDRSNGRWDWSGHAPGEAVTYAFRYKTLALPGAYDPSAAWDQTVQDITDTWYETGLPQGTWQVVYTEVLTVDRCGNEGPSCRDLDADPTTCDDTRPPINP